MAIHGNTWLVGYHLQDTWISYQDGNTFNWAMHGWLMLVGLKSSQCFFTSEMENLWKISCESAESVEGNGQAESE